MFPCNLYTEKYDIKQSLEDHIQNQHSGDKTALEMSSQTQPVCCQSCTTWTEDAKKYESLKNEHIELLCSQEKQIQNIQKLNDQIKKFSEEKQDQEKEIAKLKG